VKDNYASFVFKLCRLALLLAFENNGLPYRSEGDEEAKKRMKSVLEEAQRKEEEGEDFEGWIRVSIDTEPISKRKIYLTSAVPAMIAKFGSSVGRTKLKTQLPSLLSFYEDHVLETLKRETKVCLAHSSSIRILINLHFLSFPHHLNISDTTPSP
jgi:hypothetical protein